MEKGFGLNKLMWLLHQPGFGLWTVGAFRFMTQNLALKVCSSFFGVEKGINILFMPWGRGWEMAAASDLQVAVKAI